MKRITSLICLLLFCAGHSQTTINPGTGDAYLLFGPNSSWGEYFQVGGNGRVTSNAGIFATDGNLHLDSKDSSFKTYINHYSKGNTILNSQGGKVGVGVTNPLEKFQIGNSFTFHDGGHKVLGFLYSSSGTDLDTSKYAAEIRLDPVQGNLLLGVSPGVDNAPTTKMSIDRLGRIGIGTANTSNGVLTVNGDSGNGIRIENDLPGDEASIRLRSKSNSGTFFHSDISSYYDGSTGFIGFKTPYNNSPGIGYTFIVNNSGQVGIGTTAPDAKLTVKGDIHAEEVKVDLSVPAPDYVFREGYDLKSLEEVQNYIQQHGHLPNIPSAKEMEADGIRLGEMDMKLLEKIEELTLYILEQQKEIDILQKQNQEIVALKAAVTKMESQLKAIANSK